MPYNKDADEYYSAPSTESLSVAAALESLHLAKTKAIDKLFREQHNLGNLSLDCIYAAAVSLPECGALIDCYKQVGLHPNLGSYWVKQHISVCIKQYIDGK